jgi:REP element-mobilizing transposase RayT
MPYRKIPLVNNHYYHIYNRGNNHGNIFFENRNYHFLLNRIKENFKSAAEIIAYCFMPNHFHIIIKISDDEKFSKVVNKTFISYTKAINKAYNRSGHLFEGRYQYKLIPDNNYLLHLSRYIHLNPVKANLVNKADEWGFSSYNVFIGKTNDESIMHSIITDQIDDYESFVNSYQEDDDDYLKDLLM